MLIQVGVAEKMLYSSSWFYDNGGFDEFVVTGMLVVYFSLLVCYKWLIPLVEVVCLLLL